MQTITKNTPHKLQQIKTKTTICPAAKKNQPIKKEKTRKKNKVKGYRKTQRQDKT